MFKKLTGLTLIFGLMCSATAEQKSAVVKKTSDVKSSVQKTEEASAESKAEAQYRAQQKNEVQSEVLAAGTEAKAINQLNFLLQKYKGTSTEPSLMFRLAELYMNKAKSSRVFEMLKDDTKSESLSFLPKSMAEGKEKLIILDAIKVYEDIEQRYPDFSQIDLVIYNNGFAHLQAEMKSGAELAFLRLLKNKSLKNSPIVPDTLLALGEISFQANVFGKALTFFELIKKFPDSKVYPYGLYKSAWCLYNMQNPDEALSTMEKVVAIGHDVEKNGLDSKLDIRKEALNDMTLFFTESKASSQAISYFKQQAKNINPAPYLERVSKIYNGHGKVKDEELVLVGMVKEFPNNPRRPFFHQRLTESYESQNNISKAVENLVKFDEYCDKVLSSKETIDDIEVQECKESVDSFSYRMAKTWLKTWKKLSKDAYSTAAEQALRVHLKDQKPSLDNSKARYVFADLLFQLKKFKEASLEYQSVADTTDDKENAHDSRYAAIVSHDKAVKGKWDDKGEERLKLLVNNYTEKHPDGKYFLDVSFKVGLLDYTKKKFDLAETRFYKLGKRFPEESKGVKSQDLYLDILNNKKDYIALQSGALEWKSLEKDKKRQTDLQKIFEQAYFANAQEVVKEEKYDVAIKLYREFAIKYDSSDLADEAQWNVIDLYFKKGDSPGAASAYLDFYKKFPKHEKAVEGLIRSADLYEQMGMPERALEVSKVLSTVDKKNVASWLLLSGDFYAASGKYYEAIDEYKKIFLDQKFANAKGVSEQALESIDRVIYLADQLGTQDQYMFVLRDMSENKIAEIYSPAISTYAEGLVKKGDSYFLEDWIKKTLKRKLMAPDLAKMNYYSGTLREKDYLAMQVNDYDMNVLTKDIENKSKKLAAVQTAYNGGAKGGDAYTTVNSLVGLAGLYQGFVTSLNTINGPATFSKDEKDALKEELSNIVFPFEEKAVETVDTALKFAKKSDLRDGSVGKVQDILDKLNLKKRTISSVREFLPGAVYSNDTSVKEPK